MEFETPPINAQNLLAVVALLGSAALMARKQYSVALWICFALLCVAVIIGGS